MTTYYAFRCKPINPTALRSHLREVKKPPPATRCVRRKRQQSTRKVQDSHLLFLLTLAATPAEATPDSTSAVLRHTQVQITPEAA